MYSLGSTLFMMLSGAPTFPAGAEEAMNLVLGRIAKAPVPDLRRRGVPDAMCEVVEAAMAKAPAKRPDSAVALGDLLRAALDPGAARLAAEPRPVVAPSPVIPPPVPEPPPTPRPPPEFRATEAPPAAEPAAELPMPDSLPAAAPSTRVTPWSESYPTGEPAARAAIPEPGADPVLPEPEPAPEPVPEPVPPAPEPIPEPEPDAGPRPGPVPTALAGTIVPHSPAPGETAPEHHLDPLVPPEPHAPAIEVAPTPPPVVPAWRRPAESTTGDTDESDDTDESVDHTDEVAAATDTSTEPTTGDAAAAPAPEGRDAHEPPAITTEPLLIEGEPDESSRRRGRLVRFGLGAFVALVSLVVLVMVILDSTSNDAGTPTTAQQIPTGPTGSIAAPPAEPLSLPTVLMPSGMVVARTWELTGEDGNELVATVDINNPTEQTKSEQIIEVIPKSLAANVSQVKFEGATPVVIRADPIVRFEVTLAPGQRARIGYRIAVPADGSDPDRLSVWETDRKTEQEAFDAVLNLTVPKGQIKPGG